MRNRCDVLSSNSVYPGPDVRGEDHDDPLGDEEVVEEEEEHVEKRTVHHPVSAGPPRRGHTVCGGSGGGEGSSSNSVYPGGFVWLVVSPAIVLSLLIALRTSVVTRPSLQINHVPRN